MTVSAINVSNVNYQNKTSFKGEMRRTEKGSPYYHSNSGTKIGATLALTLGSIVAFMQPLYTMTENLIKKNKGIYSPEEFASQMDKIKDGKNTFKKLIVPVAVSLAAFVGCGMVVDAIRNKKAKKSADLVNRVGISNAMRQDENIEISKNNHPYYHSDSGLKYGALLGLICNPLIALVENPSLKKTSLKQASVVSRFIGAGISGAIGGALLGAWTDHASNKKAKKLS